MAEWYPIQNGFSVGEVGDRLTMRQDLDLYREALRLMVNYMPTKQGSAERIPGTRFLFEIDPPSAGDPDRDARVIAFVDNNDIEALLVIRAGTMEIRPNLINQDTLAGHLATSQSAIGTSRANIVLNPNFEEGDKNWVWGGNVTLGIPPLEGATFNPNFREIKLENFDTANGLSQARFRLRTIKSQDEVWNLETSVLAQGVIPLKATQTFTLRLRATIETTLALASVNGGSGDPGGNPGAVPLDNIGFRFRAGPLGGEWLYESPWRWAQNTKGDRVSADINANFNPNIAWDQPFFIQVEMGINARDDEDRWIGHTCQVRISSVVVLSDSEPFLGEIEVPEVIDPPDPIIPEFTFYTEEELEDIQFVQSPYPDKKELILVQANHPPARLYFDPTAGAGGAYVIESVPFFKDDPGATGTPEYFLPSDWAAGSYPASCTAYQGRLVLGGGGFASETVWATVNGSWANFYDLDGTADPAADHALQFTTTFRDPIQWLVGQKDLFIGAQSTEYKVDSQTGLLQPGDIDARVHTTQGSNRVQPVGLGDEVLFAAEAGRKLRALAYSRDKFGYVATDKTILNPFIVANGIRRLVRLRNPHQMLIAIRNDGVACIFSYEPTVGLEGWARMITDGRYVDVTVAQDSTGLDVPMFVIQRQIDGKKRLYVESIPGFTQFSPWVYSDSWVAYDTLGSNVLTDLGHLEGHFVEVVGDDAYLGSFKVINGQITLSDGEGLPIIPVTANVGLLKGAVLQTLPPIVDVTNTGGAGAKKRFSSISLRLRYSRPPFINGIRPPDKSSNTTMDQGEPLEPLQDVDITNLGHDIYAAITIHETLPLRSEIVGIYGKLSSNKL